MIGVSAFGTRAIRIRLLVLLSRGSSLRRRETGICICDMGSLICQKLQHNAKGRFPGGKTRVGAGPRAPCGPRKWVQGEGPFTGTTPIVPSGSSSTTSSSGKTTRSAGITGSIQQIFKGVEQPLALNRESPWLPLGFLFLCHRILHSRELNVRVVGKPRSPKLALAERQMTRNIDDSADHFEVALFRTQKRGRSRITCRPLRLPVERRWRSARNEPFHDVSGREISNTLTAPCGRQEQAPTTAGKSSASPLPKAYFPLACSSLPSPARHTSTRGVCAAPTDKWEVSADCIVTPNCSALVRASPCRRDRLRPFHQRSGRPDDAASEINTGHCLLHLQKPPLTRPGI